jgi:hypothetical protein
MELLLALLLIAVIVFAAITIMTTVQVLLLGRAGLERACELDPPEATDQWAGENDFRFIGNYAMKIGSTAARISTWQRTDRPTFLCQYVISAKNAANTACDLVTLFASDVGLTTCSSGNGQLYPRPAGSYSQSFSNIPLDEQWFRHVEMENFLMDAGGAQLVQLDGSFEDEFVSAIKKQVGYVRSLCLWPLRGPYWFFVRRRLWHNITIKEQHEKGMIKLPNESSGIDLLGPM